MKKAVFAGTFDPFTLGHLDILLRATTVFDEIIVAVVDFNDDKKSKFSLEKRIDFVKKSVRDVNGVSVQPFSGFLVDFMKDNGVKTFIRGLRNTVDFEYEKNLLSVYKSQWSDVEGYYLISNPQLTHVSSSIVRQIISLGGNLDGFVADAIKNELK